MSSTWLLAQAEVSRAVQSWSRRSSSPNENGLLLAVVLAVAIVWVGLTLWEWWWRRSHPGGMDSSPLFEQLCQAHGLSAEDARRLLGLAREQGIDRPALLFVDPRPLDRSLGSGVRGQEPGVRSPDRDALAALRRKLFGDVKCSAADGTK